MSHSKTKVMEVGLTVKDVLYVQVVVSRVRRPKNVGKTLSLYRKTSAMLVLA